MAEIHTDIDRMIMQAQYLLAMNQSPVDTDMTDMERKQYQDQIKELIQTVKTLLDANVTLGEKQKEAEDDYIKNGCQQSKESEESSDEESYESSEATNPKGYLSNLTTKVCYYLYGSRRQEVIKEFLGDIEVRNPYQCYTTSISKRRHC